MKFEQVLKIYWSKGFYFNGSLKPFNTNLNILSKSVGGYNRSLSTYFKYRFEFQKRVHGVNPDLTLSSSGFRSSVNSLLSKLTSLNNPVTTLVRLNLIRLFLIRSFRGKSHALGKPSRGQRTWSNAWNAYLVNTVTRRFIGQIRRIRAEQTRPEKINYKLLKKQLAKPKKKKGVVKDEKVKPNAWF